MHANARSRGEIAYGMTAQYRMLAPTGLVLFLLVFAGVDYLLDGPLSPKAARAGGLAAAAVTVGLIGCYCFEHQMSRLRRACLVLEGDLVLIRGVSPRGRAEVRCAVGHLLAIRIGGHRTNLDRVSEALHNYRIHRSPFVAGMRDARAGQMLVVDRNGRRTRFLYVDKLFEPARVAAFLDELAARGVSVAEEEWRVGEDGTPYGLGPPGGRTTGSPGTSSTAPS